MASQKDELTKAGWIGDVARTLRTEISIISDDICLSRYNQKYLIMFDTKIAFIVHNDLATWLRLNVVVFLATGIASFVPKVIGQPYIHAIFAPDNDETNREVFKAENAEDMDFVGIAIQEPKKDVDNVLKGLVLHK